MGSFKMVKKTFISAVTAALLVTSLNAGGLGDFIRNNLNGAIETTQPGYFKTQTGGLWYGGDMKIRWDMSGANINLFHATLPSFSVGCNGIDATFGSFSYLGFNQLVDKLKKISAAAPAMAFQMAIMTLCQQCNTIMNNLEKITDALNNFNMNGCAASTKIAKLMANAVVGSGGAQDATEYRNKSSQDEEWAFTKFITGLSQQFGSLGEQGAYNKLGSGSVLNKVAQNYSPSFMDKDEFIEIMRGLLGDLYGFDKPQKDTSGKDEPIIGKFMYVEPVITPQDFLKTLVNGGDIKGLVLVDKKDAQGHYIQAPVTEVSITIPQDESFVYLFKTKIENIINKIKTKQPLSTDDINFINSMPIPLYNIANVVATARMDFTDDNAKYLALQAARAFVEKFYQQLIEAYGALLRNPDFDATSRKEVLNWIKESSNKYNTAIKLINDEMNLYYQKIKHDYDVIKQYQDIQKQMIKNSPIWASLGL